MKLYNIQNRGQHIDSLARVCYNTDAFFENLNGKEGADMTVEKAKLFWKKDDPEKKIESIPYSETEDYYKFLKRNHNAGYQQIIISSEMMIQLLKMLVIDGYTIVNIEFAEQDTEFEENIRRLLSRMKDNPAIFVQLYEQVECLAERSSIEIQRIYFKCRRVDEKAVQIFIQSNGIIGITSSSFSEVSSQICTKVERCLFG